MKTFHNEFDTVWAPPGKVVDDQGATHTSVQAAEQNASDLILVGPGTFAENVAITTDDLTIFGTGRGSLIDGGTGHALDIQAHNVTVDSLAVQTTPGGGNAADGVFATGLSGLTLRSLTAIQSDRHGYFVESGDNIRLESCTAEQADNNGVQTGTGVSFARISGFDALPDVAGKGAFLQGRHIRFGDCGIDRVSGTGVDCPADDSHVVNGRVYKAGGDGVAMTGTNQLVDGMVVSDSAGTNLATASASGLTNGDNSTGTSTNPVIDGAEDNDLDEYSGDNINPSLFATQSSEVIKGSYAIEYTGVGDYGRIVSDRGELEAYPKKGDEFEFWVFTDVDQDVSGPEVVGATFEFQDANNKYYARLRYAVDDDLQIVSMVNGSVTAASDTASLGLSANTWYRIRVQWDDGATFGGSDGDMTAEVFDVNGNSVGGPISINDTSFNGTDTFAWFGNATDDKVCFDRARITN